MTGRELLAKLEELEDSQLDFPVVVEGCDCYGWGDQLSVKHDDLISLAFPKDYLLIQRDEQDTYPAPLDKGK